MNVKKEQEIAKKYNKQGQCYVKAEYNGVDDNGLIIAGDMVALLRVTEQLMTRISAISGNDWEDTWMAIRELHGMVDEPDVRIQGAFKPYA